MEISYLFRGRTAGLLLILAASFDGRVDLRLLLADRLNQLTSLFLLLGHDLLLLYQVALQVQHLHRGKHSCKEFSLM